MSREFVIPVHAEDLEVPREDRMHVADPRCMDGKSAAEYRKAVDGTWSRPASPRPLRRRSAPNLPPRSPPGRCAPH